MTTDMAQATPDLVLVGRVLDAGQPKRGRIRVADGRVIDVVIAEDAYNGPGRVIDVGESLLLPGVVDAHVHSYSEQGEGFTASTSAAAVGGVTTIVEMPFDGTGPINNLDRFRAKQELLADLAIVDVALLGTLEPGGGWRRASELVGAGAVGFKVSLFDTDAFRFPRITDAELINVMRAIGESGSTLCVHAENNEIIKDRLADPDNKASKDPSVHALTRPPVAETLAALTAMEIAAHEGNALHLCHLSLGRSEQLLSWYRGQGADVSFETCPHYLHFTEDDMATHKGRLKINPPLRPRSDQDAMWDAITSRSTRVISSDHAPWPASRKDNEVILSNASGVPGVQTLVPVTLGEALRRYGFGPEFQATVEALTEGPAARYGLSHRKGGLAPGMDADVIVVDVDEDYVISSEDQRSNAGWTPYDGYAPGVRVAMTFSRGRRIWDAGSGELAAGGSGTQIRRD